ncbi:MAG: sigma-70 family RNA polymerase sigma factor [Kofleriaceae bacterium]
MTALAAPLADARPEALSFDEVYAQQVGFVWRVLRSLGVPPGQLEDAAQDVFVVVHRRLPEFEGRSALTTWLFAIVRKVASKHRKRGPASPPVVPELVGHADPFRDAARAEAAAQVAAILDRMDETKRLVFSLVELEHVSVAEVARMLGINANTAASRLRLARGEFAAAVKRAKAQGDSP